MAAAAERAAGSSLGSDPLGWLYGLVLGSIETDLPQRIADFLCTTVAKYLDPFIDGEVPRGAWEARSSGLFSARLDAAWAAHRPPNAPAKLHIAPEVVLAVYIKHAVTKMNLNHGFGDHVPGLGRQPILPDEQELHAQDVEASVMRAIRSDFDAAHLRIRGLDVTEEVLQGLICAHLRACVYFQEELAVALSEANKDGEEARLQERLRIWGYC
jgi:hypothetical protein